MDDSLILADAALLTLDPERPFWERGWLRVRNGRIVDLGEGDLPVGIAAEATVRRLPHRIIMPGLVNGHTHSSANLTKGTIENLPLELWILYVFAERRHMSPEDAEVSALLGFVEMLRSGITRFLDHLPLGAEGLHAVASAYRRAGAAAVVAPMFMDRPFGETVSRPISLPGHEEPSGSDRQRLLDMVKELVEAHHNPEEGVQIGVGPSSPQRCTDWMLRETWALAEEKDLVWKTHLLETEDQALAARRLYGKTTVEHLVDLGTLGPRAVLAHAVHATDPERELMARHEATVIHNPISNLFLGSGIMPLRHDLDLGVRVALGSDAANACGRQSIFEAMKAAALLPKVGDRAFRNWPEARQILPLATGRASRAVGKGEGEIGRLAPGYRADLTVLRPGTVLTPLVEPYWQLVYAGGDDLVEHVLVEGRWLLEDGRCTTVDEEALLEEASRRGRALVRRIGEDLPSVREAAAALSRRLYGGPPTRGGDGE